MPRISTGFIIGGLVGFFAVFNVACDNLVVNGRNGNETGNGLTWMTDYEAALERAEEVGRPVLVNFTGSDWCPPCIRLEAEVFSQPEFRRFAEKELVLLIVDFPRRKELPSELQQQNQELAERYGIRGFPTIVLLNHEGAVIGQTGYRPGGVEKYVEHLEGLLEKVTNPSSGIDNPQPSCH